MVTECRFNDIVSGLTPYLRKLGFKAKDFSFIPCSGLTGAFIKESPGPGTCPWYDGPVFINYIDSLPPINRNKDGPVRVIIADKYQVPSLFQIQSQSSDAGAALQDMGTIVLGKVESGTVAKGATLTLMPNKASVQVPNIHHIPCPDEERAISR